ncbi:type IV secretory system conjugative DNA transfer family protein [Aliiroseovarius subalbicans]|uniref:type IV secretory system conjugative DNA transfer family protein n=1 Tax=Aliiroseovarius subalbicans TaxID=2925840 RepID=UPI001F55BA39|nr:type IV secretory system conjugative DNA transfer family protein [Aliiroseovarius subalbicans]MCI2400995.1 type IV secretory system conjugative DNA transfer family protein [Aliiroseovarius subalbicans]
MKSIPLWAALPFGLICGALLGTIIASFYLALALRTGFTQFDMFAVWRAGAGVRLAHPEAFKVAFGAVGFGALGLGVLAAAWSWKREQDDYGSAHWQTRVELRKNGMLQLPGKGFVCGKLGKPKPKSEFISSTEIPHVMMVGPTRAGKGVGFVIPNLLSFAGSVVVLDVKGENFDKTSRLRALNGDEVFRFSPFDWANSTHCYNPLTRIAKHSSFAQQFTEVSILADLFLDKDNKTLDTFSEAGKSIFVAACLLAIQRGTPTLGEVNKIVSAGDYKNAQYNAYAEEAKEEVVRELWTNAASASSRLLTSNIQALMTAGLKQWDNPAVRSATEASDFDFAQFRRKPHSLYIVVSEDHIATLAPLLRLMFADLIASLRLNEPGPDEPWPVMMMIDEFQQMGAMPYLERAIHSLASYGGRVAMIAQSLAALDRIYGSEGRESLENGAGLKLYITPRDQRTVREVSAAVGSTTREAVTRMYGRNKGFLGATSTSARLEERPLLSETEARLLDPDEVIILASPQHPIKAQRIKYYDDPVFTEMVEKQEGKDFPYPPGVEGVGPWVDGSDEDGEDGEQEAASTLRSRRREARAMRGAAVKSGSEGARLEDLDREDGVPPEWEQMLDRQESFIEDLLGE